MDVDGNTAESVQDASFLKKGAVVGENLNTIETTTATTSENVEIIKKTEAECSSTVDISSSLNIIIDEKDDLLEQIEEVCNDKAADLQKCADICNTSENEFLKKIEAIEKKENKTVAVVDETANNIAKEVKANNIAKELKAKNILDCEATAIDDVIIGDRVIELKNDAGDTITPSTSAAFIDDKGSPQKLVQKPVDKRESTIVAELLSKDAIVSSSTAKIEKNFPNDNNLCTKDKMEPTIQPVESTRTIDLTVVEKKAIELLENKVDNIIELDNDLEINSECMEVDVIESSDDNFENKARSTNEAKSKEIKKEEIKQTNEQNNFVEKYITPTETENKEISNQNCLTDSKALVSATENSKDVNFFNRTDEKKVEDKIIIDTKNLENKNQLDVKLKENIVSSSLNNTPVSSSNVFNSTPILKQFEISSENVSKISNAAELSRSEKEDEATSTKPITKSFEDTTTESGTCATSETDQQSSDGTMKKYIDAIKKYNGMPDTTTDEETATPSKTKQSNEKFEIKVCHLSEIDFKKDSTYEVNICCEQNDVRYLSIERVDSSNNTNTSQVNKVAASESSVQSSSNGSVNSLPAYILPQTVETPTSASTSSSTNCHSLTSSTNKHTIIGINELCNFMINQFTKIKLASNPEIAKVLGTGSNSTPTIQQNKKNKKNSPSLETPPTSVNKTKSARKRSLHDDDIVGTPKAKHAKRDISQETPKGSEAADNDDTKNGPSVLAKWVDKKFYAGKITAEKPGNKYVVLFEDGASKTLPKESIVFGEDDTLPLQDQQVYALVGEDYECGTVLSIEKCSDKIVYIVKTENTTVNVTASDIYLEIDQAKEIQKIQNVKIGDGVEEEESFGTRPSRNKRPPASPSTPEAGFSGAAGKRGGKRQKRLPFYSARTNRLSENSDSSDSLESTPPISPKEIAGLELVEGVQPELQNTSNDSELARMIFTSDYKKSEPNCDVDELLGPLPKSNALFRNKHFLLTCTVGLRPHRYHQEKADNLENNQFKQFSAVPYVKHHLQRQLEAGGAKLYNYFEDVPRNKYKQCKLIAPRPCLTAKYVQCLSSDIQAISHDWVIDSCRQNKLSDFNKYQLPAGWALLSETFAQWKIGKNNHIRISGQPFTKTYVLIAGQHSDFVELWGRVCKAAGAKIRLIKSLDDITPTTTGYMVAESDCSHEIKAKAQYYGIPVVSTVWVVQSLIMGAICPPNSHPRLSQLFEDDEI